MWLRNNQVPLVLQHIPQSWATYYLPLGEQMWGEKSHRTAWLPRRGKVSTVIIRLSYLTGWGGASIPKTREWKEGEVLVLSSFSLTYISIFWQPRIFHHCRRVEDYFFFPGDRLPHRNEKPLEIFQDSDQLHIGFGHTTLKYKQIPNIYTQLRKPCYKKTRD